MLLYFPLCLIPCHQLLKGGLQICTKLQRGGGASQMILAQIYCKYTMEFACMDPTLVSHLLSQGYWFHIVWCLLMFKYMLIRAPYQTGLPTTKWYGITTHLSRRDWAG